MADDAEMPALLPAELTTIRSPPVGGAKSCGRIEIKELAAAFAGKETFALGALAGQLARATNGFRLLASSFLGRLFVVIAKLHLAEDAFALHFLLQSPEGLIDIVIANDDLHAS